MEVLWWFLLEALAAAALLALVVWWTWPRKPKSARRGDESDSNKRG